MAVADREKDLLDASVQLADSLRAGHDVIDTMNILVEASISFTAATEAGILLAGPEGLLHLVACTSELTAEVEEAQIGFDQGPVVDAYRTGLTVEVPEIAAERHRWPSFAALAERCNLIAVHASPLSLHGHAIGGLNLFTPQVGILSDRDAALVEAMAQMATISIVQFKTTQKQAAISDQLQQALDSRVIIEQAKGVLAERHNVGSTGSRLRDVAARVVKRELDV
jgi:hypothetical protein